MASARDRCGSVMGSVSIGSCLGADRLEAMLEDFEPGKALSFKAKFLYWRIPASR